MGEFSSTLIDVGRGFGRLVGRAVFRRAAADQAALFNGQDPFLVNPVDPFPLWVLQSVIIIAMTQFLAYFLGRIRQPRVISEIIAGVLLGPSVMGRIPGFTKHIFPQPSITYLTLTSTVGLVFFLFLVGLELDVRVVKNNARASSIISATSLIFPLGIGAALALPLYSAFVEESTNKGYFILFIAVAIGITAFPVLCRILTETRLLDTTVGVVVLSAGVGNDVVGWVLLALAVALVNSTGGATAAWILLTGIGFTLFLLMPVKWVYTWGARRFGGLDRGEPTTGYMTLTLVIVLVSAMFTDIIGIHPIFGGFLAGLIVPKTNGYDIALVEKLEDFISLLLLPQYFATSGLKTNLGLLDNSLTWGYTVLVIVVAFFAKFIPSSICAKVFGFSVRESGAVGAFMACKGLVELIVLNIGLQAGILNDRIFAIFVFHALILTLVTTPLVLAFYPERLRDNALLKTKGLEAGHAGPAGDLPRGDEEYKSRFSIILDKLEHLPAAMTFTQLIKATTFSSSSTVAGDRSSIAKESPEGSITEKAPVPSTPRPQSVAIDALRLVELSERTSAVLKSVSADILMKQDPVLSVMRTFSQLNQFSVSTSLAIIPEEEFANNVSVHARNMASQLVVIPWSIAHTDLVEAEAPVSTGSANPFDMLFRKNSVSTDDVTSVATSHVIRRIFMSSPTDVALFLDRGLPTKAEGSPHLFLPFFGGPDDRLALSLVVQFCRNPDITATIVRISKTEVGQIDNSGVDAQLTYGNTTTFPDTVYAQNTQTRMQSDTADNLIWNGYAHQAGTHSAETAAALARISFSQESSSTPLHRILDISGSRNARTATKPLICVVGRSRRLAVDSHKQELLQLAQEYNAPMSSEYPKTFGEIGAAFFAAGANSSLLVVQAQSTA